MVTNTASSKNYFQTAKLTIMGKRTVVVERVVTVDDWKHCITGLILPADRKSVDSVLYD